MPDLYETLGVPKDATPDQIKKAYRAKASIHHPDKAGGDTKQFQLVQTAYDTLKDPSKKAWYDQTGEAGVDEDKALWAEVEMLVVGLAERCSSAEYQNILETAKSQLRAHKSGRVQAAQQAKQALGNLNKVQARLSGKDSKLNEALGLRISQIEAQIHQLEHQQEMIDKQLTLLDNYEYHVDERPNLFGSPGLGAVQVRHPFYI